MTHATRVAVRGVAVRGVAVVGMATLMLVASAAVGGTATPLTFTLSPGATVAAGSVLTVTDASQCQGTATVAVRAPQGEGAVVTGDGSGPGWVVHLTIPASVPPGTYVVSATCDAASYDPVTITITAATSAVPGRPALTG